MLAPAALQAALRTVPLTALGGPWYRAVNYDHLRGGPLGSSSGAPTQPLWSGGAARHGARFTPKATSGTGGAVAAIDALYCAEDELTPLMEIAGVHEHERDLGSGGPKQLGAQAFASGRIVGLRYPSSKHPGGVGVLVFPARLVPGRHQVRVFNPSGTLQQSLP